MLNSHNTRGATGALGRGMGAGRGIIHIPNAQAPVLPLLLNPLINPAVITANPVVFNPVYLAAAEQDAEDLLYADKTVAELAITPGESLETMRIKLRQLKRKREAASAEEMERAKLLTYAVDSLKELGQATAATFSKYVFSDLDGRKFLLKIILKG